MNASRSDFATIGHRAARSLLLLVGLLAGGIAYPGAPALAQELCPERFHVLVEGERLSLPFCSTHPIDEPNAAVERIVFSIHGVGTNAETYFRNMIRAAERVPGALGRTLVIAPQLLTAAYVENLDIGATDVFWNMSSQRFWGGESGSNEAHPRAVSISSFEIVDRLLAQLAEPGRFPNLKVIILAGHSGGGQFTNRYAAANTFDGEALRQRGVRIRYLVANPSTYVYLTEERVVPGVGTRDEFVVPSADLTEACPGFNTYGTGLEDLEGKWSYLAEVGGERIREQYGKRNVIYLKGMDDNDPEGGSLARGCSAMMQGAHRLERGITYFNFIEHFYKERGGHNHRISFVPGVSHDHGGMWASDQGLLHIFDFRVGGETGR
ncbi:MAG: hypothetical protein H0X65_13090 [Gemmatimonadetes bacterium]|nr:hypothetical protein [Gemmatimonadota bacterium]